MSVPMSRAVVVITYTLTHTIAVDRAEHSNLKLLLICYLSISKSTYSQKQGPIDVVIPLANPRRIYS
jgi:hypothetical protein